MWVSMPKIKDQKQGDEFFALIEKLAYFLFKRTGETNKPKNRDIADRLVFHYLNDNLGFYTGKNRSQKYNSLIQTFRVNRPLSVALDDLANDVINEGIIKR